MENEEKRCVSEQTAGLWDSRGESESESKVLIAPCRCVLESLMQNEPGVTSDTAQQVNDQKNTHTFMHCRICSEITKLYEPFL